MFPTTNLPHFFFFFLQDIREFSVVRKWYDPCLQSVRVHTHTHFSVQLEKSNLDEHTTAKGKQEVEEAIWQSRPLCGQGGSTVHALILVPCSPPCTPFLPEECYKSAGTPGCLLASAAGKEPRSAGWRGRAPAVVPESEPYARSSGLPPWWSGKAENRLYHTQAIVCLQRQFYPVLSFSLGSGIPALMQLWLKLQALFPEKYL